MTLSATDRSRLGVVRPELAALAARLFDAAPGLGLAIAIPEFGGTRSTARQAALYADSLAQGGGVLAYPVATPGNSRHEYGAAFDVDIIGDGASDAGYRDLADAGVGLGLTAGYYFSGSDPYHFQLNETLAVSIARWKALQTTRLVVVFAIVALVLLGVWLIMRKRKHA